MNVEHPTSNIERRIKKTKEKFKLYPLPVRERARVRGCFEL
jgi:hypothetical protein